MLVAEGLAWAYRFYSDDHVAAEDIARQRALGIWSAPNRPAWEHRAESRVQQPAAQLVAGSADPKCRIKGTISRSGERIYHVPGSCHYEATRINTRHGELWFCTVAEAAVAGWRPARSR